MNIEKIFSSLRKKESKISAEEMVAIRTKIEMDVEAELSGNSSQKYTHGTLKDSDGGYIQRFLAEVARRLADPVCVEAARKSLTDISNSDIKKELSPKPKREFLFPADEIAAIREKIEKDLEAELSGNSSQKYAPGTLKDSNEGYIQRFSAEVERRMADPAYVEAAREHLARAS